MCHVNQTLRNIRGQSTIQVLLTKALSSWHTSATKHADNNSKPIPNQSSILFKQESPNLHV